MTKRNRICKFTFSFRNQSRNMATSEYFKCGSIFKLKQCSVKSLDNQIINCKSNWGWFDLSDFKSWLNLDDFLIFQKLRSMTRWSEEHDFGGVDQTQEITFDLYLNVMTISTTWSGSQDRRWSIDFGRDFLSLSRLCLIRFVASPCWTSYPFSPLAASHWWRYLQAATTVIDLVVSRSAEEKKISCHPVPAAHGRP